VDALILQQFYFSLEVITRFVEGTSLPVKCVKISVLSLSRTDKRIKKNSDYVFSASRTALIEKLKKNTRTERESSGRPELDNQVLRLA